MEVTVVSLLPWAINEIKPGLIPDTYRLEPAVDGKLSLLYVKDAISNLYVRDGKTYPVTHTAEEIAKAIVEDYCIAQLQVSENARPAVFWLPGKLTEKDIRDKHASELESAKFKQRIWFQRLVTLADDDWQRYGQHRMITDLQRHAAKSLGQVNKPWMQNLEPEEFIKCPACYTATNMQAAVCSNCGFITNKEKAAALNIKDSKVEVRG